MKKTTPKGVDSSCLYGAARGERRIRVQLQGATERRRRRSGATPHKRAREQRSRWARAFARPRGGKTVSRSTNPWPTPLRTLLADGTTAHTARHGTSVAVLALAALGVVYGDIGTSPLYAIKECFAHDYGLAADARERARRPVAGVLVADPGDRRQVPDLHHAGRQPRRGRHLRAAGAPASRPSSRTSRLIVARPLRRRAALRRRHDHAGDLGAERGRGPGGRRAAARAVGRADHDRDPGGLFLVQRRGTAGLGAVFGPVTLVWFVSIASRRSAMDLREARRSLAAFDPVARGSTSSPSTACTGFLILGSVVLCVTGGEALYADMGHFGRVRSGSRGTPSSFPRCSSTTSARARCCSRSCDGRGGVAAEACQHAISRPFFVLDAASSCLPDGAARDGGHGRRVAGHDLRRLLADAAGGAARLPAARPDHPHLGHHRGADLRPGGERLPDGRLHRAGAGRRQLEQPGGGLRHRGHRHDDRHVGALLRRGAPPLGLVAAARRRPGRRSSSSSTSRSSAPTSPSSSTAAGSRWSPRSASSA